MFASDLFLDKKIFQGAGEMAHQEHAVVTKDPYSIPSADLGQVSCPSLQAASKAPALTHTCPHMAIHSLNIIKINHLKIF